MSNISVTLLGVLQEKWSAISVGLLVVSNLENESAVGEKIKRGVCISFFGWQCIGSGGGFDKHRIIKPWPKGLRNVV